MSYCRWSCDNWKSDIYCYLSDSGYVIHIAGNRVIGDIPKVPGIMEVDNETFADAYNKQMKWLDTAEREPIELPHAGESFYEQTSGKCLDRLLYLQKIGYHVPQHAIKGIKAPTTESEEPCE